mmetsp:Transcript_37614/g.67401  ORF Transcript_37614/g.67401 Transcript_37614/m.67401 type:complete len:239 (-) Transcript_37614:210-926(-)
MTWKRRRLGVQHRSGCEPRVSFEGASAWMLRYSSAQSGWSATRSLNRLNFPSFSKSLYKRMACMTSVSAASSPRCPAGHMSSSKKVGSPRLAGSACGRPILGTSLSCFPYLLRQEYPPPSPFPSESTTPSAPSLAARLPSSLLPDAPASSPTAPEPVCCLGAGSSKRPHTVLTTASAAISRTGHAVIMTFWTSGLNKRFRSRLSSQRPARKAEQVSRNIPHKPGVSVSSRGSGGSSEA